MSFLTKICIKCKITKDISEFSKNKSTLDGLQHYCKKCSKISNANYYKKDKDKILKRCEEYRNNNKKKRTEWQKKYHEQHKKAIQERGKKYRENNKEKYLKRHKEQFLKACHYTNLQPMWHIENIKKGNRI